MKNYWKQNWKGITAIVVAFSAVFGAIYYVNGIYLPGQRQAQAAKQSTTEPVTPKEYNYTINTTQPTANTTTGSGTNTADDSIKVTTDADGNVTIDRKWDHVDLDELDTSTAAPGAPTANIGSGGGKITGTDGAYHGEQAATTTPSTGSSGTATTKPSTGDSASKPSTDTEKKPSTGKTTKPTTPSTGGSTTEKPSGGSNSGSSTPKDGDIRTENGKQQEYVDGFGWVDITNNIGGTDYIDYKPDQGLSGIQVGEMD